MSQLTFAEAEYNVKKRKTRREKFLERMDNLIPWNKLERQLVKKYSKGKSGRKPYPLEVMLRVHVMQLLYNLSDPAMEDALYEIESMRSRNFSRLVLRFFTLYSASAKVNWLIGLLSVAEAAILPDVGRFSEVP